jgi:hypothetical protein
MKATGIILMVLLLLAGCADLPPDIPAPTAQLEIVDEDHGWVQVRVTGIPSHGYKLHWGDVETVYGVTNVIPSKELYEHFYQPVSAETSGGQLPMSYAIALTDDQGQVLAEESVLVQRSDCYLALVSLSGRVATVQYWGRFGIEYSVSWGDGSADHLMVNFRTGSGVLTHTYASAGVYALGMEEIWSPTRLFFTLVVE